MYDKVEFVDRTNIDIDFILSSFKLEKGQNLCQQLIASKPNNFA
jgi:hypothetical protein